MYSAKTVFKRYWRLLFFVLGIIAVFWILYALRSTLLPFIIGLVVVYLLMPAISWIEGKLPRRDKLQQTKRVSLIILFFIIILALVGLLSYYIAVAVIDAFVILVDNLPQYIARGFFELEHWTKGLQQYFPPEVQQQVYEIITDAGTAIGNAVRGIFTQSISLVPTTFGMILGFASLPLFIFYLLKDSEKLTRRFYAALPDWLAEHTKNIMQIIEKVLGRYIRAQLLLGFIVGYLCFTGLLILGISFAPVLGVFAGITELIPILGPWIGGITAVIVTLAIVPEKALWVALLFAIVQLLENSLLVPRIQAGYLRIHPVVVIFLLVVGAKLAGIWGIILAVPLTATIVEVYRYVRQNIREEENRQLPES